MVCFDGKFNKDVSETTTNIKPAHLTKFVAICSRFGCMKLLLYSLLSPVKWTIMCYKLKKLFFTGTLHVFYNCTVNLIYKSSIWRISWLICFRLSGGFDLAIKVDIFVADYPFFSFIQSNLCTNNAIFVWNLW